MTYFLVNLFIVLVKNTMSVDTFFQYGSITKHIKYRVYAALRINEPQKPNEEERVKQNIKNS